MMRRGARLGLKRRTRGGCGVAGHGPPWCCHCTSAYKLLGMGLSGPAEVGCMHAAHYPARTTGQPAAAWLMLQDSLRTALHHSRMQRAALHRTTPHCTFAVRQHTARCCVPLPLAGAVCCSGSGSGSEEESGSESGSGSGSESDEEGSSSEEESVSGCRAVLLFIVPACMHVLAVCSGSWTCMWVGGRGVA